MSRRYKLTLCAQVMPINPRPMLQNLYVPSLPTSPTAADHGANLSLAWNIELMCVYSVNEEVVIRLKWGQTEYKGRLVSIDSYMNIQLSGAVEYIDHKETGTLGQVLIRFVKQVSDEGPTQS